MTTNDEIKKKLNSVMNKVNQLGNNFGNNMNADENRRKAMAARRGIQPRRNSPIEQDMDIPLGDQVIEDVWGEYS
jgi:hypothetical protein